MSKQVHFSEAHQHIKKGVDKIADAVKSTLGPRGQNVIIRMPYGPPIITKDGVTVARHIDLEDALEDIGAALIKEVAAKTVDSVGDGTTTATVLAQAIFNQGLKNIVAGANPVDLKAGIDIAVKAVVENLKAQSRKVETLEQIIQVATISVNGDEALGKLVAEAIHTVGPDGVVMCKEGHKTGTEVKIVNGMQVDRGYASPYFATDAQKMECEFSDAFVLISDKKINKMKDLLPILEQVLKTGRPILVLADVEGEALHTIVVNKLQNRMLIATVKPPVYWDLDQYQDVAIACGTEVISDVRGVKMENVQISQLGKASKITITADSTVIAASTDNKQAVDDRVSRLKEDMEKPNVDKDLLQSRVAKLTGGVALIFVGGATEVEVKEKKDRVEDAIYATRAAVKEGIIAGGGVALYDASQAVELHHYPKDVLTGGLIVMSSIQEPLRTIISNAGKNPDVVIDHLKPHQGYNAREYRYEDMFEAGIIDPTKVARLALENAASIVGLMLTTKAVVIETPKPQGNAQGNNQ